MLQNLTGPLSQRFYARRIADLVLMVVWIAYFSNLNKIQYLLPLCMSVLRTPKIRFQSQNVDSNVGFY